MYVLHTEELGAGEHHYQEKNLTRISAFRGQKAANNKKIIGLLIEEGPQIKYQIFEKVNQKRDQGEDEIPYATISRRVDDLKEKKYIDQTGTTPTKKSPHESNVYGVTWKGLVAGILLKPSKNVTQILKENSLLSFNSKDRLLTVLEAIYSAEEINKLSLSFVSRLVSHIPHDVEPSEINDFVPYLLPTIFLMTEDLNLNNLVRRSGELLEIPIVNETFLTILDDYEQKMKKNLLAVGQMRDYVKRMSVMERKKK